MNHHVLDNPVCPAVTTEQAELGVCNELAARYSPQYSPLAGLQEASSEALVALAELTPPHGSAAVITALDRLPDSAAWKLERVVSCRQMVCCERPQMTGQHYKTLGAADAEAMLTLARETEPGPFEALTYAMGTYIGILQEGRLLAMAGERIKLPGWVEVSGVCTHPAARGKGYARALVAAMTARVIDSGNKAFLHVVIGGPSESSATRVYENVGYVHWKTVYLHALSKRGES